MTSTDQVDVLLQFQLSVMQDLQHRLLNAAPLTTLWVNSPLSRRIEQAVPPLEVQACWNKPDVTLSDEGVELAADLTGGARQAPSLRILTLDGTVSARQTFTSAVDTTQCPYVCVTEPSPLQVDLRQLKISYEGSRWPELLATLNPAKEATALRPVLASQLFGQLARLPLTCMPCSLPLRVPDQAGRVAAGTLPIKRAVPGLFATPASVALGFQLSDQHANPALSVGVMPPQSPYNAAIALSEHGLNTLHLCTRGVASGQMHHTQLGEIAWRWDNLSVKLRQDVLAVSGLLDQQGMKRAVEAELKSGVVNEGCLQSQIVSSNLDASGTETLLAAWNGVLTMLLRARAANSQDQDERDAARLYQCFALPTSTQTIECVAQELLVTDEQLILYYTLPTSEQEVPLEIPPPKPGVSITQPHLPQQTAQGVPITIELDAHILKDSTPPYDYAWTNDLSPNPVPQFGATYRISTVPVAATAAGAEPQTLTTAHLKVIDMFGQVAQTQVPAKYLPAPKKQQPSPKMARASLASASQGMIGSLPTWLLVALAGIVVLAASGITFALTLGGGGGTPSRPGSIAEFAVPTASSHPDGITAGPDGNLWFKESYASKIGRITSRGAITEFPAPTQFIGAITKGPDGNLWFNESFRGIGRITPGGSISEFPLPAADSSPTAITAGPDGNRWFIEPGTNKIGRITPSGKITGYSAPPDLASDAPGSRTAGLPGIFLLVIPFDGPYVQRTPAR